MTHIITFVGRGLPGQVGFHRCGREFTIAGTRVERSEFTDAEWATLEAEPFLKIAEAGQEGAVEADGSASTPLPPEADDEVRDEFDRAVRGLAPGDFGKSGPDLRALRAAMGGRSLTTEQRDAYWQRLLASGFEAPAGE